MYISLNWINEFTKIPAKIKPAQIAEALTGHTVEVESFFNQADLFHNVVVGEVLSVSPHPHADRLRLAIVDIKTTQLSIVCGASNLAVGQNVPVALIGATLPNGLKIQETEIRGEKSFGMICAEDELGLGEDHEGIMVLSKGAKIGQEFSKYLDNKDIIFEVDNKSLSNRPDLLGHYGIARELSAILDLPLKPYDKFISNKIKFLADKDNTLEVKIDNKKLCPRYVAVKIAKIEVKDSPGWLKNRLIAVSQRPVNNIVDLTNYVMLESGQPLHAFAADKVDRIIVRQANRNEKIEGLDGKTRELDEDDLVIASSNKSIAIAGIMGGSNSEIDDSTTEIILESANFQAASIRKTSQKLGLRTEASTRFEKSLDHNMTEKAALRFLSLLKEICPKCEINSSFIDINNASTETKAIELDPEWLSRKIGQDIPREQVIKFLNKLGFIVEENEATLLVTIPSWRATKDISTKEDLVEEVLRLYGYDKISAQMPSVIMAMPETNNARLLERKIKNILALKYSLNESYNYSFLGEDHLKKLEIDFSNYLQLANPLSDIYSILRQTLAPNLINNIKTNQMKADEIGFFEIGRVYLNAPGNLAKDMSSEENSLPYQEDHLGIVLAGNNGKVFDRLKSIIVGLAHNVINSEAEVEFAYLENRPNWSDEKIVAKIIIDKKELGRVALVSKTVINNLNLKKEVAVAELNFSEMVEFILKQPAFKFKEVAKYPAVIRDLAFVIDKEVLYNDLKEEIISFNPLIASVDLFDVYEGEKINDDKKSLAFHLCYQSKEKTLTSDEVDKIQNELVNHLAQTFEAQLRDF